MDDSEVCEICRADLAGEGPARARVASEFDLGTVFFHDFYHTRLFGLKDPRRSMLHKMPTMKGETVERVNKVRRELGLPTRDQYQVKKDKDGRYYLPFSNGPVYLPGPGGD